MSSRLLGFAVIIIIIFKSNSSLRSYRLAYFASHLFVCVRVDGKERLLELKLLRSQQLAPPGFCV